MPRCLTFLFALLIAGSLAASADFARAQAPASSAASSAPAAPVGNWPTWINEKAPDQFKSKNFERGPGFYFSVIKLGCSALLFFLWLAVCDWINRDIRNFSQLRYRIWNVIAYAPFAIAFLLQFVIPWYALSVALMIPAVVAPLTVYVRKRNKPLPADERVFTPLHFRQILAEQLRPLGIKVSAQPRKKGLDPPITLLARSAPSPEEGQKREIAVRQSQGQAHLRDLILKSIGHRASGIMLDFSADAVAVKFLIDGVWLDGEPLPRPVGDPVLVSLKTLCGLRPDDRRTRQVGTFTAVEDATKKKFLAKLTSQGTKTGERALIQYDDPSIKKRRLPDYSLRPKVLEDLQNLLTAKKGLFVVSAAPGVGLTSLTTACLAAIDRYTRSVMAVEDKQAPDIEVENVPITTYDSLEQENPMTKLPGVIRQFPDVIFVPDMANTETATFLCEEAISEDRLIVTTSRGRDAVEGLLQPAITTKAPLKKYAAAVTGSIAQKLVRKLCDSCKEAYPPQPQILQKLGIPADKVNAFYRPPTEPRKEVCKDCAGLGYKDQVAIVELLVVDDLVRQTMIREPRAEVIRAAARKQGMKTFEDEGLMLVVKGVTSVAELSRVLKEGAPPAAAAAPAAAQAGAPPAGPSVAKPAASASKPAPKAGAQPPQKPGAPPPQKRPGT